MTATATPQGRTGPTPPPQGSWFSTNNVIFTTSGRALIKEAREYHARLREERALTDELRDAEAAFTMNMHIIDEGPLADATAARAALTAANEELAQRVGTARQASRDAKLRHPGEYTPTSTPTAVHTGLSDRQTLRAEAAADLRDSEGPAKDRGDMMYYNILDQLKRLSDRPAHELGEAHEVPHTKHRLYFPDPMEEQRHCRALYVLFNGRSHGRYDQSQSVRTAFNIWLGDLDPKPLLLRFKLDSMSAYTDICRALSLSTGILQHDQADIDALAAQYEVMTVAIEAAQDLLHR